MPPMNSSRRRERMGKVGRGDRIGDGRKRLLLLVRYGGVSSELLTGSFGCTILFCFETTLGTTLDSRYIVSEDGIS